MPKAGKSPVAVAWAWPHFHAAPNRYATTRECRPGFGDQPSRASHMFTTVHPRGTTRKLRQFSLSFPRQTAASAVPQPRRVREITSAATPSKKSATCPEKACSWHQKAFLGVRTGLPLPSWKVSTTSSTWQPSAPGAQPPSPPPLAPEAYDFRVIARDAQGKLRLVTGAGAFDDFEEATAFAVTLMDCW